jgi:hypothetical protein
MVASSSPEDVRDISWAPSKIAGELGRRKSHESRNGSDDVTQLP